MKSEKEQTMTINDPDASVGAQCSTFRTVCSHNALAVGFNIPLSMAKKTVVFAIGKTTPF